MTEKYRSVTMQLTWAILLLFIAGAIAIYGDTAVARALGVFFEGALAAFMAFGAGARAAS